METRPILSILILHSGCLHKSQTPIRNINSTNNSFSLAIANVFVNCVLRLRVRLGFLLNATTLIFSIKQVTWSKLMNIKCQIDYVICFDAKNECCIVKWKLVLCRRSFKFYISCQLIASLLRQPIWSLYFEINISYWLSQQKLHSVMQIWDVGVLLYYSICLMH